MAVLTVLHCLPIPGSRVRVVVQVMMDWRGPLKQVSWIPKIAPFHHLPFYYRVTGINTYAIYVFFFPVLDCP